MSVRFSEVDDLYYYSSEIDGFINLYCSKSHRRLFQAHDSQIDRIHATTIIDHGQECFELDYIGRLLLIVSLYEASLDL